MTEDLSNLGEVPARVFLGLNTYRREPPILVAGTALFEGNDSPQTDVIPVVY